MTTALITGGNRGLGRATALALAGAGLDVVVTYRVHAEEARDVVDRIEALGRRAAALPLDVGDPSTFPAFRSALRAHLPDGRLDVLVNNAGSALYRGLDAVTEPEVDRVVAEHLKGPLFLTQVIADLLADGARVVNVSSALTRITLAGSGPYASAKAAVEALTRYQALELAPRGITVNVVAPGAVPTDFGDGHLREDPQLQEAVTQSTALGRLATPGDVADAITGLVTASGSWVTGQRIEASGGLRL
ncbi:MAG: SDR family oxidoreductase [Solirubrobacteraceae bacterium]|nr:SDR family oxidoreductase [Solirubrobacteraceae bacterium]